MPSKDTTEVRKLKRLIKKHTDAQVALSKSDRRDVKSVTELAGEAKRAKKVLFEHISTLNDSLYWYI